MFQQMIEALADAKAGGVRQRLAAPTSDSLMQETADRFSAPTGDERVAPQPQHPDPNVEAEERAERDVIDSVTDPDGHTHSSGGSLAWGGHQNGRIPTDALTDIGGGHRLENSAATAWQQMVADAKADGVNLTLTDSYRDFAGQVSVRERKGDKVATATPGTSVHGWGKAVDVAGDDARAWVQRNGARYGWIWPEWAQRKGTKSFEPWHFEFRPSGGAAPVAPDGGTPENVR
jgi:LAS superfamily LD-carboxypeptidase LdcB